MVVARFLPQAAPMLREGQAERRQTATELPEGPAPPPLLRHLAALTFDFVRGDMPVSAIAVYAEPAGGDYRLTVAAETGYEGVACLDDTARAAVLALDVYATTGEEAARTFAYRWLSFVRYMQYPDGSFANFIRNAAGVRNVSSPTSVRGGYWWSARARWALARAFGVIGDPEYRRRFHACRLAPLLDGKMSALLALGELELFAADPTPDLRAKIVAQCERVLEVTGTSAYFLDQPGRPDIHLWGYHQLEALARAGQVFGRPDFLEACARTVHALIAPAVGARFWHAFPARTTDGVCAYDVSPTVRGLSALYRATGDPGYRRLALDAAAWLYGRNGARTRMFDLRSGRCRDGIAGGRASANSGAESSIEAGFIELERRTLLAE